jgi:uncharacterized protein YdcH (DUF465 family)
MPVKHDLLQDLGLAREEVAALRGADGKLNQLLHDYERIDAQVVVAESGSAHGIKDEDLRKMKEQRVNVKKQIVKRLRPDG